MLMRLLYFANMGIYFIRNGLPEVSVSELFMPSNNAGYRLSPVGLHLDVCSNH